MPVMLGPIGIAGMYRRRGEVQAARAAMNFGIPFCLSTVSLCSLAEVAAVASNRHLWFQLYVIRDRAFMRDLLQTATALGIRALVFTVDMPVPGPRYRDGRSGMSRPRASLRRILQACGKPGWAWDVGLRGRPHRLGNLEPVLGKASGLNDYMGWLGANFDPTIAWKDLEWIRSSWKGPLITCNSGGAGMVTNVDMPKSWGSLTRSACLQQQLARIFAGQSREVFSRLWPAPSVMEFLGSGFVPGFGSRVWQPLRLTSSAMVNVS
jgi:hypothetical protein